MHSKEIALSAVKTNATYVVTVGTKDGITVRYVGMPQLLLRSTLRWYGTPFL